MGTNKEQDLSRRERQIMDVIYIAGTATAAEVVEAMPDKLSNSTVRTLLRILEEKGHLKHELDGQRYVYWPTRPRPKAAQGALKRVLDTFYAGSVEQVVEGLLHAPDAQLDEAQLKRIQEMIGKARKEGH